MHPADLHQVQVWLRAKASLAEVEGSAVGALGNYRYSQSAVRLYRPLWIWSAPRFGGEVGRVHDKAYSRLGQGMYNKRIERAKARISAIMCNHN